MDMDNMNKYVGKLLDNRYELLEIIGSGGMAVVYKALCHRLNRYVAVKILRDELAQDSEFRARFQAESQAVAMLSHPNIVSVYDVSHTDEVEYIVMELIEGVTLKQYMREKGAISWKEALHFSTQVASALSHAHSKGIVHRDIKPQNLMVVSDGNIKVADFGIAHLQSEVASNTGETIGSVHYISPEQARGLPVDARSDIYSLGIVMYEMLSGRLPFDNEDEMKIPLMHVSTIPTPLPELKDNIPAELVNITMKAMDPNLETRYQTAGEMLHDLKALAKKYSLNAKLPEGVEPLSNLGELSREKYLRRRRRARTISILSGFFGVTVFILFISTFLWNYWLRDLFSVAQRVEIPSFTGENYETIVNSGSYSGFRFTCIYDINPDVPEGIVISQSPEAGKSYMMTDDGIEVELRISTGVVMYEIGSYENTDYKEASIQLEKLGFKVEKVYEASDTVTEGYVISVSPAPGEKLPVGSTVYLVISKGPEVKTVIMPNLIGKSLWTAADQLETLGLNLMPVIYVASSDYGEGQVVSQTVDAGLEVELHTKVYLTVSTGPEATPEPDMMVPQD